VGFHASRHCWKEGIELGDLGVLVFANWTLERIFISGLRNRGKASIYIYIHGSLDAARIRSRQSLIALNVERSLVLSRRTFSVLTSDDLWVAEVSHTQTETSLLGPATSFQRRSDRTLVVDRVF